MHTCKYNYPAICSKVMNFQSILHLILSSYHNLNTYKLSVVWCGLSLIHLSCYAGLSALCGGVSNSSPSRGPGELSLCLLTATTSCIHSPGRVYIDSKGLLLPCDLSLPDHAQSREQRVYVSAGFQRIHIQSIYGNES